MANPFSNLDPQLQQQQQQFQQQQFQQEALKRLYESRTQPPTEQPVAPPPPFNAILMSILSKIAGPGPASPAPGAVGEMLKALTQQDAVPPTGQLLASLQQGALRHAVPRRS